jgi:hypothetical protein
MKETIKNEIILYCSGLYVSTLEWRLRVFVWANSGAGSSRLPVVLMVLLVVINESEISLQKEPVLRSFIHTATYFSLKILLLELASYIRADFETIICQVKETVYEDQNENLSRLWCCACCPGTVRYLEFDGNTFCT